MKAISAKKTILGFKPGEVLGILLIIIPFFISFKTFTTTEQVRVAIFFRKTTTETNSLMPGLVSAFSSVAFYCALLVRFKLFKSNNLGEGIASAIQTFLNCWVVAALLTMIVPTEEIKGLSLSAFLQNQQTMLLLLAILLSWIGMRTVSGYCWILFIIAAWKNIMKLDQAMGAWGAVFVITLVVSLLLQISSYADISDVIRDFSGSTSAHAATARNNMSAAAVDAEQRAENVSSFVQDKIAAYTPVKLRTAQQSQVTAGTGAVYYVGKNTEPATAAPSRSIPAGNPEDILKALDVNGDGVVDEKDIELLRGRK